MRSKTGQEHLMHSNSFLECRKIFPERHTQLSITRDMGGVGRAVSEGMVTSCGWGWKQNVTNTVNKLWLGDKCVQSVMYHVT